MMKIELYSEEKVVQYKWLHSDQVRGGCKGEEGAENVNVHNSGIFSTFFLSFDKTVNGNGGYLIPIAKENVQCNTKCGCER